METVKKIKYLMDVEQITSYKLAQMLHIATSSMSYWWTGKSQSYMKYLPDIAQKFEVPVSFFVDGSPLEAWIFAIEHREIVYDDLNAALYFYAPVYGDKEYLMTCDVPSFICFATKMIKRMFIINGELIIEKNEDTDRAIQYMGQKTVPERLNGFHPLSSDELSWLEAYRQLDKHGKLLVDTVLELETSRINTKI